MKLKPVIAQPPRVVYRDARKEREDIMTGAEPEEAEEDVEAEEVEEIVERAEVTRDVEEHVRETEAVETGVTNALDQLRNTIPAEVLLLWATLEAAAELYSLPFEVYVALLVFVVIAMPVYVYRAIETPTEPTVEASSEQWWEIANRQWQSVLAVGAFLVWVYYLGGPFKMAGLQDPGIAAVLVIMFPVVVVTSQFYGSFIFYYLSKTRHPSGNQPQDVL